MSRTVSIDEMDNAIMEELEKYADLAADELKAAVKETAASVRKDIQAGAPVDTSKYKKSWSVKNVREDSESIELVVHSRNRYQIAHLLEHGHAKRRSVLLQSLISPLPSSAEMKAGADHRAETERRLI